MFTISRLTCVGLFFSYFFVLFVFSFPCYICVMTMSYVCLMLNKGIVCSVLNNYNNSSYKIKVTGGNIFFKKSKVSNKYWQYISLVKSLPTCNTNLLYYRLHCGFLFHPDGRLESMSWTDMEFQNLGDDGKPTNKFTIKFKAGMCSLSQGSPVLDYFFHIFLTIFYEGGLIWHKTQSSIRLSIYFSLIMKSFSNPFL